MDTEDTKPNPPRLPQVPGLELLTLIARGGHGSVYCARQTHHDRLVAVKVLDARFTNEDTRRRFDRERVALGRISDHPSIVPLIDSGYTEAGEPYLLLEYAPGGSLAEHLVEHGPMDLDAATKMIINLAAAAECTHAAGIVHRDIKPGNILQSAYGDWMLTDFGIASLVDGSFTSTLQISYAHAAPENFDGHPPSPLNDVYSLASVLATCLTGNEPFEVAPGESPVSAMRRVAMDPYPDLRLHHVPDDLAALLEMALSKEPSQRPISALGFAAALNEIRKNHDLTALEIRTGAEECGDTTTTVDPADLNAAMAPSWVTSTSMPVPEPPKDRRRTRSIIAACALIIALFVIGVVTSTDLDALDLQEVAASIVDGGDNNNDGDNNNGGDDDGDGRGNGNRRGNDGNDGGGRGNGGGGNGNNGGGGPGNDGGN